MYVAALEAMEELGMPILKPYETHSRGEGYETASRRVSTWQEGSADNKIHSNAHVFHVEASISKIRPAHSKYPRCAVDFNMLSMHSYGVRFRDDPRIMDSDLDIAAELRHAVQWAADDMEMPVEEKLLCDHPRLPAWHERAGA